MKRRDHKASAASMVSGKGQASNARPLDQMSGSERGDPFATFTEWSGEADEKAYADL